MNTPSQIRKHSKGSKKKRFPKKNVEAKQDVEEEEVVWFSNPSKQAARARREEAKDIMGRELWNKIMEDSSDDEDDEDEEFYFYEGGWHSSPRPIKDLLVEAKSPKDTSQVQAFCEGSGKNMVGVVESINQNLHKVTEDNAVRVRADQIKSVLNKDADPNNRNHGNVEFAGFAVENVEESNVVVDNDDDTQEITQKSDTIVASVLFEHKDLQEQTNESDAENPQGHNDDADLDLRLPETHTANVVLKDETNDYVNDYSAMGPSHQVKIISIESNEQPQLNGFKHKIQCWIRCVGRKTRGWSAKIRRTLTACCINTHITETTQSQ